MKKILMQFIMVLAGIMQCKSQEKDSTTIIFNLPAEGIVRLRYLNDQFEIVPITFSNRTMQAQKISKTVPINKASIFRYSMSNNDQTYNHQLLIFPKDTVHLNFNPNGDIFEGEKSKGKLFVEQYGQGFGSANGDQKASPDSLTRLNDLKVLNNLLKNNGISENYYNAVKSLVDIRYYNFSTASVYKNFKQNELKLKQLFDEIESKFRNGEFSKTNIIDILDVYEKLITYKLIKSNLSSLTDYFKIVYQDNQAYIGKEIIKRKLLLYANKYDSEYLNAVKYLDSIGFKTESKKKIPKDVLAILLDAENGQKKTLQNELDSLPKNGILVLDFWASWCAPCIEEFPHVKVRQEELAKFPIKFLPLDMDADSKRKIWSEISKIYPYLFKAKNYRILDKDKKAISRLFGLNAIPKYVLLNKDGVIINDDFVRPSDKGFNDGLMSYLRRMDQ